MQRLQIKWIKPTSENPRIARMQSRAATLIPSLIAAGVLFSLTGIILGLVQGSIPTTAYLVLIAVPMLVFTGWLYRIEFSAIAAFVLMLTLTGLFLAIVYASGSILMVMLSLIVITAASTYMFGFFPSVLIILLVQVLYLSSGWFSAGLNLPDPPIQLPIDQVLLQAAALILTSALLHFFLQNPARDYTLTEALPTEQAPAADEAEAARTDETLLSRKHHAPGEIARLATRMTSPEELMKTACELIQEINDYYHVGIYLLDNSETWAEIAVGTGEIGEQLLTRQHRLAVGSASLIGWVTANRLPRIAQDAARDPFFFKHPLLPDTRSEMVYPLLIGDRLLGVLDVQSDETGAFNGENLRILEAAGNELAIAIENARLLSDTRTRLERIEREFTEQSMESWRRILRGEPGLEFRRGISRNTDTGPLDALTSRAASLGKTYIDAQRRALAVPIRVRGQTIATIALRKTESEEPWSDDDIALIEALSSQTSLALETARQYSEEQRRVAELEVINRISQAVSQLLRLDSLYRVVHTQINQVLGRADLTIGLFDEKTGDLNFPYSTRKKQPVDMQSAKPGEDAFGDVLSNRQPVLLNTRVEIHALLGDFAGSFSEAHSLLAVPMLFGNEIIGLIALHDPEQEQRFSEDDTALLTTISSQIATAIQNTHLLRQIRSSARREQLIREITTRIRRAPDIQSILDTSVRELGRALNVSLASVQLGIPHSEDQDGMDDYTTYPDEAQQG